jgi:hypothetical protein
MENWEWYQYFSLADNGDSNNQHFTFSITGLPTTRVTNVEETMYVKIFLEDYINETPYVDNVMAWGEIKFTPALCTVTTLTVTSYS